MERLIKPISIARTLHQGVRFARTFACRGRTRGDFESQPHTTHYVFKVYFDCTLFVKELARRMDYFLLLVHDHKQCDQWHSEKKK